MSPVESAIRTAYRQLSQMTGRDHLGNDRSDWVNLAELRARPEMQGLPRGEVDEMLRVLNRQRGINIIPESNQSRMTSSDWAATVAIGNERRLLIRIRQH